MRWLGWRPRLTIEQAVIWAIEGYQTLLRQRDTSWLVEQIHAYQELRPDRQQVQPPRAEPVHAYA